MPLEGPNLRVLRVCNDNRPKDVPDREIAQQTGLNLEEVRNCLWSLEGQKLVDMVKKTDHMTAQITPDGELYVSQHRPLPKERTQTPEEGLVKVVPKGLRSYDKDDAGFFLDLLPPPRLADGLPEIIHFWKVRIEEPEPDTMFRVGVIYGPSGCGKSSLVKAGLLPRLSDHILRVYVEATPDQTEADLPKHIRWKCPDLPPDLGLVGTLGPAKD